MIIPQSHANSFKMIPLKDVDVCKFVDRLDQDLDRFMDRFKDLIGPIWTSLWTSLNHSYQFGFFFGSICWFTFFTNPDKVI